MVRMSRLSTQQRVRVGSALVEGNSIRATCRTTDAAKNTVVKLLVDLAGTYSAYHDQVMRNLSCQRFQCDDV
jgi:MOSC domain-containing protein YiiM